MTDTSKLEAAFRAAEDEEKAEQSRVIGAVRFMAYSAEEEHMRSRLLDVVDGYDRAKKKADDALLAWLAALGPRDDRLAQERDEAKRQCSAVVAQWLNTEDELHALASAVLDLWDGTTDIRGCGSILANDQTDPDAEALRELVSAVADTALAIYRRRVPADNGDRDANKTEQARDELASRRADARAYAEEHGR